jgi:predicted transcriptional regulator/DNA-binding XRE family transcriptional regulator
MRKAKVFAGRRVCRLREAHGISQAELARRVGISSSYLNQIEHDQRPLSARVMQRIGDHFGVGLDHFGGDDGLRIAQDLREALADPIFGRARIDLAEIHAAVETTPGIVRRLLSLHRAFSAQGDQLDASRTTAAPPPPYEEVRDWVQDRLNYFDRIDRAAEDLHEAAALSSLHLREQLIALLRTRHGITTLHDSGLLADGVFWRLDRREKRLVLAESATSESRVFWIAHLVGQLEHRRLLEDEVRKAGLSSEEARMLARVALGNYFAGALILPYRRFLETARALRYDIERLASRFGASFEQVCHRMSTMQRPGARGIPFYFAKTDIAGNILKRSSATRFQFSRLGGPCPLWNVYRTSRWRGPPTTSAISISRGRSGVRAARIFRDRAPSPWFSAARSNMRPKRSIRPVSISRTETRTSRSDRDAGLANARRAGIAPCRPSRGNSMSGRRNGASYPTGSKRAEGPRVSLRGPARVSPASHEGEAKAGPFCI